jgi:hypothetical protein
MSVAQCRQAPAAFSKNCDRLLVTALAREFLAASWRTRRWHRFKLPS